MSLELLDTLDACLERAAALWPDVSIPAQTRIIATSLTWSQQCEIDGLTQARHWIAALDFGAREACAQAADGTTAGRGFAGQDAFSEAIEMTRLTIDRLGPRTLGLLSDAFDMAKCGHVAPNLIAALQLATREIYDAALAVALKRAA